MIQDPITGVVYLTEADLADMRMAAELWLASPQGQDRLQQVREHAPEPGGPDAKDTDRPAP